MFFFGTVKDILYLTQDRLGGAVPYFLRGESNIFYWTGEIASTPVAQNIPQYTTFCVTPY